MTSTGYNRALRGNGIIALQGNGIIRNSIASFLDRPIRNMTNHGATLAADKVLSIIRGNGYKLTGSGSTYYSKANKKTRPTKAKKKK